MLAAYLRPSKIDGAKHSRALLKLLVDQFRRIWPKVKIVVRADSGFCRWRMVLHLASSYPLKSLFEWVVRRLSESHLCPT